MTKRRHAVIAAVLWLALPTVAPADNDCGYSPDDWCTNKSEGDCGRHANALACRKDPACIGMRYKGESIVACHWDKNGYADNCPTVGCLDRK